MSPITELIGSAKAYGWGKAASAIYYDSIATADFSGGMAADATFSNIPQTYRHLVIRGSIQNENGTGGYNNVASHQIRLNGETTATNYYAHQMYHNYVDGYGGFEYASTFPFIYDNASGESQKFTGFTAIIYDYRNTNKFKTGIAYSHAINSNGSITAFLSFLYKSTSAISSLKVINPTRNVSQNSIISLYGINGVV